jgi:ferredoxin
MSDVEFRLEREDREGIVAVGTYLSDAVTRMGSSFDGPCGQDPENPHRCSVHIVEGGEYLSHPTQAERDYLAIPGVSLDERLACQVRLERPGRVVVMTKEKKKEAETQTEDHTESFKKEFAEMPLEKKIASLVQLEALALGETISFVINSPFALAGKVMDVMAEFGFKMEKESKEAKRPEEHKSTSENGSAEKEKAAKGKTKAAREDEKSDS